MLKLQKLLFSCLLLGVIAASSADSPRSLGQPREGKLRLLRTVLGSEAPFSFPEKIVSGPQQRLYILDTELSNVFVVDIKTEKTVPLCTPRMLVRPSDMSVDARGNVWILDSAKKRIVKFSGKCEEQISFTCRHFPLGFQVNTFGGVVVLASEGETLFDLYDPSGKFIRGFGQRPQYGDPIADGELNDGHLVSDSAGGFYFSFNYPGLIRHYARDGHLLSEFKPETNIKIEPPEVLSKKQGNRLTVSSRYQILVLDLAVDSRGRLILLMSGENKYEALTHGSKSILVTTGDGKTLRRTEIQDHAFNRLAVTAGTLYLLRNRTPLLLDQYPLP